MKYEDLCFTIKDITGESIKCEILSLIPKNDIDTYVVYTDRELDENENIIFKYGILRKIGSDYELKGHLFNEELDYIKEKFHEDILEYVDDIRKGKFNYENI